MSASTSSTNPHRCSSTQDPQQSKTKKRVGNCTQAVAVDLAQVARGRHRHRRLAVAGMAGVAAAIRAPRAATVFAELGDLVTTSAILGKRRHHTAARSVRVWSCSHHR